MRFLLLKVVLIRITMKYFFLIVDSTVSDFPNRTLLLVVHDNNSQTPSRVNASSFYWDGCQVNHEHNNANWKWCQNHQVKNKSTIRNSCQVVELKQKL